MKKVIVGVWLSLVATLVYANCTTNTVFLPDGRMMICQTCCYSGNCTTNCF
jgi:hypothetical protein